MRPQACILVCTENVDFDWMLAKCTCMNVCHKNEVKAIVIFF